MAKNTAWDIYNLGKNYYDGKNGVKQDYAKAVEYYTRAALQGHAAAQCGLGFCYKNGEGVTQDHAKAVEWFTKAANQKNKYAQYNLGLCYENGEGVTRDYKKALEWYTKAANQEYKNAKEAVERLKASQSTQSAQELYDLGKNYYYGKNGVAKDYAKAVEYYTKAALQGHAGAQCSLGFCYDQGQGVPQDYAKAVEWYTKSADQGNMYAQYNLGLSYKNGRGVAQDYKKAVEWFTKAAEQGDADAQSWMGFCYRNGHGVTQDYAKAFEWYSKAAKQGDADAQNWIGYFYENGWGVAQDYKKAVEWYTKSANQGYMYAQNNLGVYYEYGWGVAQDYAKAIEWYSKAADQGYENAKKAVERLRASQPTQSAQDLYDLGQNYYYGRNGVAKDYAKAVEYYTKAALQGHDDAQYRVGFCYENGWGVLKDHKKAVEWYTKAAEQGNVYAQNNLGVQYEYGRGVPRDYQKAVEWFTKAAEQGYADAQYHLGDCYEYGWGVTQDINKAFEWYSRAADEGHENAEKSAERLKKKYPNLKFTPIYKAASFKSSPAAKTIKLKYRVNADGETCTLTGRGTVKDKDITIPSSIDGYAVTGIGTGAFQNDAGLASAVIPDSVTYIGDSAFFGCEGLAHAVIPESVSAIGNLTFCNCTSLKNIEFPESVTYIGDSAFEGCKALTGLTLPESLTNIGEGAFQACVGLTGVVIPDSVQTVGAKAFRGCTRLAIAVIGSSVTAIGEEAFADCENLKSISLGESVEELGEKAFACAGRIEVSENNSRFASVDGNLYDKDKARLLLCAAAKKKTAFTVPDFVESIGPQAFRDCQKLTSVTFPTSLEYIDKEAFLGSGVSTIRYNGTEEQWNRIRKAPDWKAGSNIRTFEFAESVGQRSKTAAPSVKLSFRLAYTVNKDGSTCTVTGQGECTDKAIVIPGMLDGYEVTAVKTDETNRSGFDSDITSLRIPNTVTAIGENAFAGCTSLTSAVIPDSVKTIGDGAFSGAGKVEVSDGNSHYASVGGDLYTKDMSVLLHCDAAKAGVFALPASVTVIGKGAFSGCKNLETVAYHGSKKQWEEIRLQTGWNENSSIHTVKCKFGKIKIK